MIKSSGILEWDSNFFGKTIAFIDAGNAPDGQIREEINKMSHCDLIYLYTLHPIDLKGYNAVLADIKRSYVLEKPVYGKTDNNTITSDQFSPADLYDLAIQAGEHSRYKVDPNFTQQEFEQLYKTWIDNSINEGFADHVLATYDFTSNPNIRKATGLITAKRSGNELSIGLFATDEKYRRHGIGSGLIQEIMNIASEGHMSVEVTTQRDNAKACKFYENRGFVLAKEEYIYHIWNKM